MVRPRPFAARFAAQLAALLLAGPAAAELAAEELGTALELPRPPSAHWVLVGDFVLRRAALLDTESGRFLGMVNGGLGVISPLVSAERGELYLPATYYSLGTRGVRSDVVTIYDAARLAPLAEIEIPPKRADVVHGNALATRVDDGRFLAVYNFTPATSLSIVDLDERRFAGEIAAPGCALVYAAGRRRLAMLCGDGSLLLISLDARGGEAGRVRSERFFDPIADPVMEKAVRWRDQWLFVSFDGIVHPVDLSGEAARFAETWPLFGEADRAASWRVGGSQPLAVHEATGRLYALVHQGGPDGHKEPGTEVWVYDLATRARVQTIAIPNLVASFLGERMGVTEGAGSWLLQRAIPNRGADSLAVTQGAEPRLLMAFREAGSVAVIDATSGAWLRNLEQVGLAPSSLVAPWR